MFYPVKWFCARPTFSNRSLTPLARFFFSDAGRDPAPCRCYAFFACACVRGWAMRLSQALNLLGRLCSNRKVEGTEEYMEARGLRGFLAAAVLQEVRAVYIQLWRVLFFSPASPAVNRRRERLKYDIVYSIHYPCTTVLVVLKGFSALFLIHPPHLTPFHPTSPRPDDCRARVTRRHSPRPRSLGNHARPRWRLAVASSFYAWRMRSRGWTRRLPLCRAGGRGRRRRRRLFRRLG